MKPSVLFCGCERVGCSFANCSFVFVRDLKIHEQPPLALNTKVFCLVFLKQTRDAGAKVPFVGARPSTR